MDRNVALPVILKTSKEKYGFSLGLALLELDHSSVSVEHSMDLQITL